MSKKALELLTLHIFIIHDRTKKLYYTWTSNVIEAVRGNEARRVQCTATQSWLWSAKSTTVFS